MLICQYCGHQEMNDSENFCTCCGAPLRPIENRIAVSGGDKMVVHGGEKLAVSGENKLAEVEKGKLANVSASAVPAVKQNTAAAAANKAAAAPVAKKSKKGLATVGMILSIIGLALTAEFTTLFAGIGDEDALIGGTVLSFFPATIALLGLIFSAVSMKDNPSKKKNIAGLICAGIALLLYVGSAGVCIGYNLY